jgi:hypothetical protein
VCDRTPFLPRHSAIAHDQPALGRGVRRHAGVRVGRLDKSTHAVPVHRLPGVATAGFNSALLSGEIAIPAATAGQVMALEVSLARYMTMRCSAYTSGVAGGVLWPDAGAHPPSR